MGAKTKRGLTIIDRDHKQSYSVRFTLDGKEYKRILNIPVTEKNHKVAEKALDSIRVFAQSGDVERINHYLTSPIDARMSKTSVRVALNEYLESRKDAPAESMRKMRGYVAKLAPMYKYTLEQLERHPAPIYEMIESWGDISIKTCSNNLAPLRDIFHRAHLKRIIKDDPMLAVRPGDFIKSKRRKEIDPYSLEEIDAIVSRAGHWADFFEFWFFTGLRTSEMYGLKWEDVGDDSVYIRRAVVAGEEKCTKTEAGERHVYLLPRARAALKRARAVSGLSEYIWLDENRKPLNNYDLTRAKLTHICKLAKVPYREQRQIRHSFASNMLSGGENPWQIAKMMGHRDVTMVMQVYGKWIEQGREAARFVSDFANQSGTKTALLK